MDNLVEIEIDILDDKFVVDSKSVAVNFQKKTWQRTERHWKHKKRCPQFWGDVYWELYAG